MKPELRIRYRQRGSALNTRQLRQITLTLLTELLQLEKVELGISIVGSPEMAEVNWRYLRHEGATDVITFDHTAGQLSRQPGRTPNQISGELFICLEEAKIHARTFRTSWPVELVRYIVHGVLHLLGHDDHSAVQRRHMKRAENRLLRCLETKFQLATLARPRTRT